MGPSLTGKHTHLSRRSTPLGVRGNAHQNQEKSREKWKEKVKKRQQVQGKQDMKKKTKPKKGKMKTNKEEIKVTKRILKINKSKMIPLHFFYQFYLIIYEFIHLPDFRNLLIPSLTNSTRAFNLRDHKSFPYLLIHSFIYLFTIFFFAKQAVSFIQHIRSLIPSIIYIFINIATSLSLHFCFYFLYLHIFTALFFFSSFFLNFRIYFCCFIMAFFFLFPVPFHVF